MANVFLSYARDDLAKAELVTAALERLGHSVWWDRRVQGGSRFSLEIEQALKSADVVLVLWSRTSVQSAWVTDEAAEGRDSGRLVPVVIDDSKPPLGFRQFQSIDLSGWKGRANAPAITMLHEAIVARSGPAEHAVAPPKPIKAGRDFRRWGIALGSLSVLALASLLYWLNGPASQQDPGALRLQLGRFEVLSQDVPQKVPLTLREEILGALATDAVIIASTDQQTTGSDPGYGLTASIGRTGDLLRFTVHVANKRTGATVWTETLERPAALTDIAPRQVAVALSQVLRCGLGGVARYPHAMPDATLSIFFNYCEEYWADTMGKQMNPTRSLDLAHRVTEAAPDFSRGWSALATSAAWVGRENGLSEALRKEAVQAAERAIKLDQENSEAYSALAGLEPQFAFAAREKLYLKSIGVRPSDCGCEYVGFGGMLSRVGRNADAAAAYRRAHDMIPLSADVNANWAEALFVLGRTGEAREAANSALELWPDHSGIRELLVRSAIWTGRYDEALKLLADPKTPISEPERLALGIGLKALKSGGTASKQGAIQALQKLAVEGSTQGPLVIALLAALGAEQQALTLAAVHIQRDGPSALSVLFQPPLAAARTTPQFTQLAERFGLVSYWRQSGHLPDFCKERSPSQLCARL